MVSQNTQANIDVVTLQRGVSQLGLLNLPRIQQHSRPSSHFTCSLFLISFNNFKQVSSSFKFYLLSQHNPILKIYNLVLNNMWLNKFYPLFNDQGWVRSP